MNASDFKQCVARLEELNGVIAKLDPAIRAESFGLLKAYVTGTMQPPQDLPSHAFGVSQQEADQLFTKFGSDKPAENVSLIAADFYARYGCEPFSQTDVRSTADAAGLIVPERIDKTLTSARRDGKALFHRVGRDRYKPTVGAGRSVSQFSTTRKSTPARHRLRWSRFAKA
jgi:hypothetical protein